MSFIRDFFYPTREPFPYALSWSFLLHAACRFVLHPLEASIILFYLDEIAHLIRQNELSTVSP